MAEIKKVYDLTLDMKRQSNIELKGIVSGDNGNVFKITLTNGGAEISDADINACRAILNVRNNAFGWRSQDSIMEDSDVTIADGVITVKLHAATFGAGQNLARLEVYSKTAGSPIWDTLVTTQDFSFAAAAGTSEAVETSDEYPALVDAVRRANEAVDNLVGLDRVYVNDNSHLIVKYTDGREVDVGSLTTLGTESNHIVMTGIGGNLTAGNRIFFGTDEPDADNFREGDIYVRETVDWNELSAEATTLEAGADATVSYNVEQNKISFGIPKGDPYDHSPEFSNLAQQVREDAVSANQSETAASQALSDLLRMMGTDIATLVGGKIPVEQIPSIATTEIYSVSTIAQRDALRVERGDICIVTSENKSYIFNGNGWVYLESPTDYASRAGYAETAGTAENANMINGHRMVQMTASQYETAVKDANTYYLVY